MKKIYIYIGLLLIILNSIIGKMFTDYKSFNWLLGNLIIITNIIFLQIIYNSKISDGFKISLNFIIPFIGIVTFILCLISKNKLENNIIFSGIIILLSLQTILLLISNKINNK